MVKLKNEKDNHTLQKTTEKIMLKTKYQSKRKTIFLNYPMRNQTLCDFLRMISTLCTHVTITPTSVVVEDGPPDIQHVGFYVPLSVYSSATTKFLQTHILPRLDGIHYTCQTDLPKLFSPFRNKIWRALTYSFYASSVINKRDGLEEIDKIKTHITLNDSDIILEKMLPFYEGIESDITKQFIIAYRDLKNIQEKSIDDITLLNKICLCIEQVQVPQQVSQLYYTDSWVHQQEIYSVKYIVNRYVLNDFVNLSEATDESSLQEQELYNHLLETTHICLKSKLFLLP